MAVEMRDRHMTPPVMDPEDGARDGVSDPETIELSQEELRRMDGAGYLALAADAWQASQTWFDSSMRVALERAYAHFRGVHAPGSKYHTDQYAKKSRIFRPKTRSSIRRTEAAAAVAFFSTHDVVHCSAENDTDERQRLAAEVHNALLNYRLSKPRHYWYLTALGACQDAATTGVVISKQDWEFEEAEQVEFVEYDDGSYEEVRTRELLKDRPRIQLLPVENFRFSPSADWLDPVNSSPYTIEIQPTLVADIMARAQTGEYYEDLRRSTVGAAVSQDWDSVRRAREGQRLDKHDSYHGVSDFRIVYVYHYIMRINGQDWCWDQLGNEYLLQDPIPIRTRYPHCKTGMRPYVMGSAILEAHKVYPGGIAQLIDDLQEEANDEANIRLDSLKHWINPHWIVRRGRGVDVQSLIRNVPSGVTFATDPNSDVKEMAKQGFPAAAFEQENRINLDIDDIVGNFSQASVQTNRQLNQTVGGMNMVQGDANLIQEYTVRTVATTWMQPVMEQLVRMEAIYEDDERILTAISARLRKDFEAVKSVLSESVEVNINIGFGATNPEKRIAKLALALNTLATYFPDEVQKADRAEITKEVFGAVGLDDGSRFFPHLRDLGGQEDPRIAQMQDTINQLQSLLQGKQMEIQGRITVAEIAAAGAEARERIKQETELYKVQAQGDLERFRMLMQMRLDQLDRQIQAETNDRERQKLWMAREALSQQILESNREWQLQLDQMDKAEKAEAVEGSGTSGGAGEGGAGGDSGAPPAPPTPDDGMAGVIARDQYELIPENTM